MLFKNVSSKTRLAWLISLGAVLVIVVILLAVSCTLRGNGDGAASSLSGQSSGGATLSSDLAGVPAEAYTVAQTAVLTWGNWDSFQVTESCRGDYTAADAALAQRYVELSQVVTQVGTGSLLTSNMQTDDPMYNDYGECWRSVFQAYGDPVLSSVSTQNLGSSNTDVRVAVIGVPVYWTITTNIKVGTSGVGISSGRGGEIPGTGNTFSGTAIVMATVTLDPIAYSSYPAVSTDGKKGDYGLPLPVAQPTTGNVVFAIQTPSLDLTVLPSGVTSSSKS